MNSTAKKIIQQNHQLLVDNWNLRYQVGQTVRFWTELREGEGRTGMTTYAALILGGHTPGVYIRGDDGENVGFVSLSHVEATA